MSFRFGKQDKEQQPALEGKGSVWRPGPGNEVVTGGGAWANLLPMEETDQVDGEPTYSLCSPVAQRLYSALRAGGRDQSTVDGQSEHKDH